VPNPKAVGETTEAVILAHLIRRGDLVHYRSATTSGTT